MAEFKRNDGRQPDEYRTPIKAKVGIVPNADGSAMYQSGKTIAIASVFGPKKMHPAHAQDPEKGTLRCNYSMLSFSVQDRIRPGPSRRSTEISKIMEWALEPVLLIDKFSNMVIDVHVSIIQADAGTRCAAINAAAMALAHAGIPMKSLVSSIAAGKLDKTIVLDLDKYEDSEYDEGEGSTDIPMTFTPDGKLTHIQVDGKINKTQLMQAIDMARNAAKDIYEVQKEALKEAGKEIEGGKK